MPQKELLMENEINSEKAFTRLLDIVKLLRKECPWDKEQTHKSLKVCMLEEAYEVCHAIDEEDDENLREELGDVLLQIAFHSIIDEEEGKFNITDVINSVCEKMIRRHPHIFSEKKAKSLDKVVEKWEDIKREEHEYETYTDEIKSIPRGLPILMKSHKVQKKVGEAISNTSNIDETMDQIYKKVHMLEEKIHKEESHSIEKEFGELLFEMVNLSRELHINPEIALMSSTESFVDRFQELEMTLSKKGKDLKMTTKEETESLWRVVK